MRARLAILSSVLLACGPASSANDAGPDTSCGLDCAAQAYYGLLVDRCFEYSDDAATPSDPPDLGAVVLPVFTLDGNVKVLPVEYRQGGMTVMRDSFGFKNGELYLMRREFSRGGQSVTYRDEAKVITGVKWLSGAPQVGETSTTPTQALVVNQAGAGDPMGATYRVTIAEPSNGELKTPLQTYPTAFKLLFSESPADNGSDSRRIFVPNVGFTLVASAFSLSPLPATPMMLQRVRDIGTPDGGTTPCSLGSP
ncbi:MAG: hypothetical protein JNG84_12110 [Archangium sp.]|nr:hypothetical protein [Archangium sp.]